MSTVCLFASVGGLARLTDLFFREGRNFSPRRQHWHDWHQHQAVAPWMFSWTVTEFGRRGVWGALHRFDCVCFLGQHQCTLDCSKVFLMVDSSSSTCLSSSLGATAMGVAAELVAWRVCCRQCLLASGTGTVGDSDRHKICFLSQRVQLTLVLYNPTWSLTVA